MEALNMLIYFVAISYFQLFERDQDNRILLWYMYYGRILICMNRSTNICIIISIFEMLKRYKSYDQYFHNMFSQFFLLLRCERISISDLFPHANISLDLFKSFLRHNLHASICLMSWPVCLMSWPVCLMSWPVCLRCWPVCFRGWPVQQGAVRPAKYSWDDAADARCAECAFKGSFILHYLHYTGCSLNIVFFP